MSICKDCDYYDSCSLSGPNNKCREYHYNLELLELLEKMIEGIFKLSINDGYYLSYSEDLKEKLDEMFDKETEENK